MGTRKLLKEAGHLVRVALVLAAGLLLFVVIQRVLVPADFGRYGHYRAGTLADVRSHPVKYAGHEACAMCHGDIVDVKSQGKHANVSCEACHGPLAAHAEDPTSVKPKLPDVADLCHRCHEADAAKPKAFPQVNIEEHSGGAPCNACHQPHRPKP